MARTSKKLEQAKRSAANARKRAKKSKGNLQEKAATLAAGAGVGWLEKSGNLQRLPTLGGVPPELSLCAMALAGEMYTRPGSMVHNAMKGAATGLLFATARSYVATGSVSGFTSPGVAGYIDEAPGVAGYAEDAVFVD